MSDNENGGGIEARLERLEQQNERILGLLEKIAESSFSYKGKKLPEQKPDFAPVEAALKAALSAPELAALVALDGFEVREWVAEAKLLHKVEDLRNDWEKLEGLVNAVSRECGLPGRPAGWYWDPDDIQRMIGTTLHFGYSKEVGYDHENDFHTPREEAKK